MNISGSFLVILVAILITVHARNTKIVGGEDAAIQDYPNIVAILYEYVTFTRQECGGTILTSRTILTSAHCLTLVDYRQIRIRSGSTYASTGGTLHYVSRSIFHEQYSNLAYDVGMVQLMTPITFSDAAQPARIASNLYYLPDDESVWAAGWGATEMMGAYSETLQHVELKTVPQALCSSNTYLLCAGWLGIGGKDQCQGDSGGPVFHNGVLVGITSFGFGCALPNQVGYNMRVSYFASWIRQKVNELR